MAMEDEMKSLVRYQHIISLLVVLIAGITAWNNVQAQTETNETKIVELQGKQEKTEDQIDDIQKSVVRIETTQQFIQDDLKEIKSLLIRSLGD